MTTSVVLDPTFRVVSVEIRREVDVVMARQRARQVAELLGFARQDQVRIATAVSEIARNAYQYAKGGRVEFSLDLHARPQMLWVRVSDHGPGIRDVNAVLAGGYESRTGMGIGLAGSKRLMDEFSIESKEGEGTRVALGRMIPGPDVLDKSSLGRMSLALAEQQNSAGSQELERQNRDLLLTLNTLRMREAELERRKQELDRLNLELQETNRGVVALYAELDEKALALRNADEMKSRLLRHVSHEFRTPVNSVLALSRLLLQRADGDLTPEQEKQVTYIRQAVEHLAEMVNDLLDLAKVEAGKSELHVSAIDVAQFLGAIRGLMRPLATNPEVALIFDERPPGLEVFTDESKLGQIVRNLISNALKFTQRGEVRVSAETSESGRDLCITVKDTGIGIAPEHHERIFQEFAQIDSPMQRKVKGTGLGLPLSRKLAELLGGTLAVDSSPGRGSVFTLTVPRHLPAAAGIDGEASGTRSVSNTILVVDDDPTARYLVRQLFRGSRFDVVEATSVEAAERARFERPALIILDLIMPDPSGFEVLQELRANETTRDIPVVIHTSKELGPADFARLQGDHAAILPKGARERMPALLKMREILGDDGLFSGEPEFQG